MSIDRIFDRMAHVGRKIADLEKRVAALESPKIPTLSDGGIAGTTSEGVAKLAGREAVIAHAKADVAELLDRNYPLGDVYNPSVYFTAKDGYHKTDDCKFVINRDKRTVVALINVIGGRVIRKGIAKCAPGDVFNVHIGKAIALRRALGLAVTDDYVNAPQPTEIKAGDIVARSSGTVFSNGDKAVRVRNIDGGKVWFDIGTWLSCGSLEVIDDSGGDPA